MELALVQKQVMSRTAIVVMFLAGAAIVFGQTPAALGVLIGGPMAILNFRLLALGAVRLLETNEPNVARIQAFVRYSIRYGLTFLVLFVVSLYPQVDFFAVAVGLLSVKIVILGGALLEFVREQVALALPPRERRD